MKRICLLILLVGTLSVTCTAQKLNEMVNLERYAKDNIALKADVKNKPLVVFIGNSITEGWVNVHPEFFTGNHYVGRGISGQTSPQLLLRFRQDVLELKPTAVVINIGTNDIAENTGTYNPEFTLGNIQSMAELAKANGIRVILSAVLPVGEYPWRKEIKNVPATIDALNKKIRDYALANKLTYIDYNSAMRDAEGALIKDLGHDGVHPTAKGFDIMEALAKAAINGK